MPSVVIPQAKVQGTFTSGSFVVSGTNPGDVLRIAANIKPVDLIKAGLVANIRLYLFDPGTGLWRFIGGAGWVGHAANTVNPVLEITLPVTGSTIRGELDVPTQMTIGATIETGPPLIEV